MRAIELTHSTAEEDDVAMTLYCTSQGDIVTIKKSRTGRTVLAALAMFTD